MASFKELSHTRNGKWSNSDWEVTTNTAKLIVTMEPFDGWTEDMDFCVKHIWDTNKEFGVSIEESKIAFEFLFPRAFKRCMEKNISENDLI